jgi:hypothetical protein
MRRTLSRVKIKGLCWEAYSSLLGARGMTQLIVVLFFMFLSFGALQAQDLPPLPPAAGDNVSVSVTASTPPVAAGGTMPALPPLPSSASSAPSADVSASMSTSSSAGSDNSQPASWSSSNLQTPPSGPAAAAVVPDVPKASMPKHRHKMTPQEQYRYDHDRPNVIYGGWVWPKGQDVDDKLAWTSQEVLNALVPHGFTVTKEEGNYDGEDTSSFQWRQWTFSIDHSQVITQVYIKPVKHRIWMRVGPFEAPAGMSLREVEAIRGQDLRMLKLLRHKFGKRFTPHHRGNWTAPYDHKRGTADE